MDVATRRRRHCRWPVVAASLVRLLGTVNSPAPAQKSGNGAVFGVETG